MPENNCNLCHREKWNTDRDNAKFDDKYCIFHSPKVDEKEEEFRRKFIQDYPERFIDKNKILNFEGFYFPNFDELKKKDIDTPANFKNVNFMGFVDFKSTKFKRVDFSFAKFYKDVNFSEAIFNIQTDFGLTSFYRNVDFSFAIFNLRNNFANSLFKGTLDLSGTIFSDSLSFSSVEFIDNLVFYNTKIEYAVIFIDVIFHNSFDIHEIDCEGDLLFQSCRFKNHLDLENTKYKRITFENCINEKSINLHNINNLISLSIDRLKNFGFIFIDWELDAVDRLIKNNDFNFSIYANQFRILKENYRKQGLYEQEDLAYYEFKRNSIKIRKQEIWAELKELVGKHKFPKILRIPQIYIKFIFDYIVQELIGGFGTRPGRIAISMFSTVLLFSTGYYFFCPQHTYLESFYHSIITFLTIGYGEGAFKEIYSSVGLTIWSGVEGFLGLFLMSYFTVAFVRKVLR